MSVGRRDYTWGFLNEAAGEGRYRETFIDYFVITISSWIQKTVYSYTVPAGYRLGITGIFVSCDNGAVNMVLAKAGATQKLIGYFTGSQKFEISDNNPLYFNAGQVFTIDVYNRDEVSTFCKGWVCGIKEAII